MLLNIRRTLPLAAAAFLATGSVSAIAQDTATVRDTTTIKSSSGIYNAAQVARGKDTYLGLCVSCHKEADHTGGLFAKDWVGKPLWQLYEYIRETMPKSDPGTLTPGEYAQVLTYILKLNNQPEGANELVSDSTFLKRVRIDWDTVSLVLPRPEVKRKQ